MKLHGVGTEQSEAEAREWFEKSARLGNPNAQYQLAMLYLLGHKPDDHEEQTRYNQTM